MGRGSTCEVTTVWGKLEINLVFHLASDNGFCSNAICGVIDNETRDGRIKMSGCAKELVRDFAGDVRSKLAFYLTRVPAEDQACFLIIIREKVLAELNAELAKRLNG
jgi:hypothetical protein